MRTSENHPNLARDHPTGDLARGAANHPKIIRRSGAITRRSEESFL